MNRYLVLSFDDGPIEDIRFVELLNKYNIPATFNLNSGLENFVWYYENKIPIERIKFNECLNLYDNHEIASHTINHPYLTDLSEQELIHQVETDVKGLEKAFNREVTSFAVPFTECNEREIDIIKNNMLDFPNNYHEQYSRDFKVLENSIMEGYNMVPDITTNTLLHLAESLAMYYYSYMDNEINNP